MSLAWLTLRRSLLAVSGACGFHLFVSNVVSCDLATGPSMMPTIPTYAWFLTSKMHRLGRGIQVGDLVCYQIPVFENSFGVKRVIGMPGDYVLMDTPGEGSQKMIQIPAGHVWLVGDNLPASRDSRTLGPIPMGLIVGKILAQIFPWDEAHWIRNPLTKQLAGKRD